ncbi:MAG: OmpA family protein [Endomicrobium sp.]|jgi:predicted outer membrane repeat protein|nr:OmpA family protein [Endomicrobium sp.]
MKNIISIPLFIIFTFLNKCAAHQKIKLAFLVSLVCISFSAAAWTQTTSTSAFVSDYNNSAVSAIELGSNLAFDKTRLSASVNSFNNYIDSSSVFGESLHLEKGAESFNKGALNCAADGGVIYGANEEGSGAYDYIGYLALLKWDLFVADYKALTANDTITMTENLTASDGDNNPFGAPGSLDNITIYGGGYALNSANYANLGFVLSNSSAMFKDISFENFLSSNTVNAFGGAMQVVAGSTVNFTGIINFINNRDVENGYDACGGAVYNSGAVVNFTNGSMDFTKNSATHYGGAIHNTDVSKIDFTNSHVNFTSNNSALSGGAVFNANADINFTGGSVNFTNNKANDGGAIYNERASIIFSGININFTNNSVDTSGGGIFNINHSTINFVNVSADFIGGRAREGGGIHNHANSVINFTGANVNFSSVSADIGAGAIENTDALISFTNSSVNFTNASASYGGALYAGDNSNTNFAGSTVKFSGNSASSYAGAVFNDDKSTMTFTNSSVNFVSNRANAGGAVYNYYDSIMNFANSGVDFTSNSAALGGAVYNWNAVMNFTGGRINFSSNSTAEDYSYGGAIYNRAAGINFTSNVVSFTGNSAGYSGAIYNFSDGKINFTGSTITFSGNTAINLGGAVYNDTSCEITFNASRAVFSANTAKSTANDIYNDGIINVNNKSYVEINGGILGKGTLNINDNSKVQFAAVNSTAGSLNIDATSEIGLSADFTDINNVVNTIIYVGDNIALAKNQSRVSLKATGKWGWSCDKIAVIYANNGTTASDEVFTTGSSRYAFEWGAGTNGYNATGYLVLLKWNSFAADYNELIAGATITLPESITAKNGDNNAFGISGSRENITIDGAGFTLDSANYENLGFILSNASATFKDISFKNFSSTQIRAGGAISAAGSTITFNGTINFTSNSADNYGGAIYNNDGANVNFTNADVNFTGNRANNVGGAFASFSNSTINLTNTDVTFTSNSADSGGAILNYDNSKIIFTSGSANFTGSVSSCGGAIYNDISSIISFTNTRTKFTGNSAYIGGAVHNGYASTIRFISGEASFSGNIAQSSGGAIYNKGSLILDTSLGKEIVFTGNKAAVGNDIYQESGGATTISGSGNVIINDGIAGEGLITKEGSGIFYINAHSGGYAGTFTQNNGKTIISSGSFGGTHNINNGSELEFANGSAFTNGSEYALNNATMTISANNELTFNGKLSGNGIINKTGGGKLTFEGNISFTSGTFNASNGEVAFASGAGYRGNAFNIRGAVLNMQNDSAEEIRANDFTSGTKLKMDIFSNGGSDKITASKANIGGGIEIKAGVGTFNNVSYDLIIATGGAGSLSGVFISSSISDASLKYELIYINDIVRLVINGVSTSRFGDLGGLSYNQSQTAKTFDKMSELSAGEWNTILSEMNSKQNSGTEQGIAEVKNFLAHTSGYFFANVIRNAAADSPNNEIYDKIRNHLGEYKTNGGLWAQVKGGLEVFKEDDNSIKDYKDFSIGLMFGFDRFLAVKLLGGDLMYGVYARINKDNIKQGKNRADGNKNGLGIYGGYAFGILELKAMLLGSYDKFSLEREVLGRIGKSDIDALTISADIEGALKLKLSETLMIRPYAGIEIEETSYKGFKERNAGIYNLDTKGGNYLRSAARLGAGIDYEKGNWIWYGALEGKYLIEGNKPEIESVFENTDIDFYSRGSQEGKIAIGIGAGAEKRISKHWKIFANAKYYAAQRYENISGNIGVRYLFGHKEKKEEPQAPALQEEEAVIIQEPSEEQYLKDMEEAQERRKRKMIKTFKLEFHFETNIHVLKEESKELIAKTAEEIKSYRFKKITIEGHTDSTGSKEFNRKLSRQRAKSVYEEFIKAGIAKEKMSYFGFGEEMPIESNKTHQGRAANRRTEVFVE